jgi:hypothetical protein
MGSVAEMSSTSSQQQCCFVAVSQDNHRMLQAAIQSFPVSNSRSKSMGW